MFRFALRTALLGSMAVGSAAAVFGPDQLVRWVHDGKETVEKHIADLNTLETELGTIQDRVDELDQEILDLKEQSLAEQVEIEALQTEIDDRATGVERLRENLERADALLESELRSIRIRGITYSRDEIQRDVEEKMRLYQVQNETLRQLRETMEMKQGALAMVHENVQRGQALREELQGKVRLLSASLDKYRAREAYAEAVTLDFDAQEFTTEIGEARQLLAKFEQKLEVKNRLLDERMKIAQDSDVAGIDYTQPTEVNHSLRDEISKILSEDAAQQVASHR